MAEDYRKFKAYHLVYTELINAARYRGLTTYQDIAKIMDLPMAGNYMGREVGNMLGAISEEEVKHGRPMLSAVAVGTSGEPGEGFYSLAQDLENDVGEEKEEKRKFWKNELKKVYETWKRDLT